MLHRIDISSLFSIFLLLLFNDPLELINLSSTLFIDLTDPSNLALILSLLDLPLSFLLADLFINLTDLSNIIVCLNTQLHLESHSFSLLLPKSLLHSSQSSQLSLCCKKVICKLVILGDSPLQIGLTLRFQGHIVRI